MDLTVKTYAIRGRRGEGKEHWTLKDQSSLYFIPLVSRNPRFLPIKSCNSLPYSDLSTHREI